MNLIRNPILASADETTHADPVNLSRQGGRRRHHRMIWNEWFAYPISHQTVSDLYDTTAAALQYGTVDLLELTKRVGAMHPFEPPPRHSTSHTSWLLWKLLPPGSVSPT
eukprot:scaffold4523_cov50-Attheya_sp.AAC.4